MGILIFGVVAMVSIKIFKLKEEESEDYHRSGVLVPFEETEA